MAQATITIYQQLCYVTTKIKVDRNRGIPLPKSVLPSTIIVLSQSQFLPFDFTNTHNKPKRGRVLTKTGKLLEGVISDLTDHTVTVYTDTNQYRIRDYDTVEIDHLGYQSSFPTLYPHLKETTEIQLTYALDQVSWRCIGTGIIDKNHLKMRLAAYVTNDSESELAGSVTLVSGNLKIPSKTMTLQSRPVSLMATTRVTEFEPASSSDYMRYDVGAKKIDHASFIDLEHWDTPLTKIYRTTTHPYSPVYFGYTFKTPKYLPHCDVNFSSADMMFLGNATLNEARPDDDVHFYLGETTVIQAKTEIVPDNQLAPVHPDKNSDAKDIVTERLKCQVRYEAKHGPVVLYLEHRLDHGRKIKHVSCADYRLTPDGLILFKIPIILDTTEFTCTLQYYSD